LLNDVRTHGLWEMTAAPGPPTALLRGSAVADVAVIGAGYTGLSTALHLSELGAAVSVVESVDVGFGASGRNAGLVNAGVWVQPDKVAATLGPQMGERLLKILGDAPRYVFDTIEKYNIQCDAERNGTLHCAVGPRGLRDITRRAEQWQSRSVKVVLLDAAQTATQVGSSRFAGSLLDPRAGTIQPLAYARGLARAAVDLGTTIYAGEPVTGSEQSAAGWLIKTKSGSLRANWVVVATDAYATDVWPQIRRQQMHLPYFNFSTRPLEAALRNSVLPGRHAIWDTRRVLSSIRMDRAGRLVIGSVGALRGSGSRIHRAWARRTLVRMFPQLGEVVFDNEWYGLIGMTSNSMPRFHKLAANVVAISGYNGRGIGPATVLGRLLAQYINGSIAERDLPLPAALAREPPLRHMREIMYEVGSQVVHSLER